MKIKNRKPKSKHNIFISSDICNIDRYIIEQIDYISNWTISDADKIDVIKWLINWYPSATLSTKAINRLLDIACDRYTRDI